MSSGTKKLQERYRKFREWQREPRRFSVKDSSVQHCACCGHEYEGNYCPVCGQAAGDGRITWSWVRKSILLLWGMDSRSMPYTIWQLIWRPGYLIGEYISGRRHVSYPPVKMLFIVVVFYALVKQLLGIKTLGSQLNETTDTFIVIIDWLVAHPGWGMMFMTMIMILPTQILFRYSTRHTRHTLPESIFIQIFMSTLILLVIILWRSISAWLLLLIPLYYYITYRQLFGYTIWGTLWRTLTCFIVWIMTMLLLTACSSIIFYGFDPVSFRNLCILIVLITLILTGGYWIGRKNSRPQQSDNQ